MIDVSINFVDGRMVGDVKKSSYGYLQTLGGLTPVPGGVGQCTVIALMENVIQIAETEGCPTLMRFQNMNTEEE